jgi:pSer/pThr/pTyr-binding forkhead associated (FHA) protein
MREPCPHCGSRLGARDQPCPTCGEDRGSTIGAPIPLLQPSSAPVPGAARPAAVRPPSPSEEGIPPPRLWRRGAESPWSSDIAPVPAPLVAAVPGSPILPPPEGAGPSAAHGSADPPPGGLRGKLIRMLGGHIEAPPAAGAAPPLRDASPAAPAPAPARTSRPAHEPAPGAAAGAERTVGMPGASLAVKAPRGRHYLQILEKGSHWSDPMPIEAGGKKVKLASRVIMRLFYEETRLLVEDPGTLNGLYLRITQPVELADDVRFRIGTYLFEFESASSGAFDPVELLRQDDEEFCCHDLAPLAYLDLIRPDGLPGLRFPITLPDLIIGRVKEKTEAHIALPGDPLVSSRHARIAHRGGRSFLEDLQSTNGTYVRIARDAPAPVKAGDEILFGQVLFRISDDPRR